MALLIIFLLDITLSNFIFDFNEFGVKTKNYKKNLKKAHKKKKSYISRFYVENQSQIIIIIIIIIIQI